MHLLNQIEKHELQWLIDKIVKKRRKSALDLSETILGTRVTSEEKARLERWCFDRIGRNKPIQYILKDVLFCGLEIVVRPPVLIPRWETEEWTMALIEKTVKYNGLRILDLCTGTGCIALALGNHLKGSEVVGIDKSPLAIKLARLNARKLGLKNIHFECRDVLDLLNGGSIGQFDVVVANPPYIPPEHFNGLDPGVKDWEDKDALVSEEDGIFLLKNIIEIGRKVLSPMKRVVPRMVLEINGTHQIRPLSKFAKDFKVHIHKDMAGQDRALFLSD